MPRGPDPRNKTVRALLARSGNQCAFPNCVHALVNHKNQFVAELCHIRAAAPGGPRYDGSMTDEERRSYENLLLLCHAHHVETDDVDEFPVEALIKMKREHEAKVGSRPYNPPRSVILDVLASLVENYTLMNLRAMRAEVPSNVDGIRVAQKAYFAEHGTYLSCGDEQSARRTLTRIPRAWVDSPEWRRLGWSADGRVRGAYWTVSRGDDFEVHGVIDCDGDGRAAEYVATRWQKATMVTPPDVF